MMSVFSMSGSLGLAVGSLIIIPITSMFGLKATLATVVPAVVLFAISVKPILSVKITHEAKHSQINLIEAVKPHIFLLLNLFFVVVIRAIIIMTFGGFIPLYLTSQGQSEMFGGTALAVFQFFTTAGILLGGYLFDKFGAKKILIISFVFNIPLAIGFINYPSVWGLPFLGMMGLFLASSTPVNILLGQHIVPSNASFVSALMMGFGWGVGGLLMAPIGALGDAIGLYWTLTFVSIISVLGLILVLVFPYKKIR